MLLGTVALATGLFLLSLVNHIGAFIAVYGTLLALGMTFCGPITVSTLVVRWFKRLRGKAMGIAAVGVSVGGFIIPPLAAALIQSGGWRMTYAVFACASVAILIPTLWWTIVDDPEDLALRPDGDRLVNDVVEPARRTDVQPRLSVIYGNRTFWIVGLFIGLGGMVYTATLVNLAPFALERGLTSIQGALLISVVTACMIIGKLLIGATTDKVPAQSMLVVALFLAASGTLILGAAKTMPGLITGCTVLGIGCGGFTPLTAMITSAGFPSSAFTKAMGLVTPFTLIVAAPGAAIAGFAFDRTGSYSATLWLFSVLLFIASGVLLLSIRTRVSASK